MYMNNYIPYRNW